MSRKKRGQKRREYSTELKEEAAFGQETATTCKWRWLRDFCHRALHGFRPTRIVQPLLKGDTERTTGALWPGLQGCDSHAPLNRSSSLSMMNADSSRRFVFSFNRTSPLCPLFFNHGNSSS